jgi:hypothetical protein
LKYFEKQIEGSTHIYSFVYKAPKTQNLFQLYVKAIRAAVKKKNMKTAAENITKIIFSNDDVE